MADEQGPGRTSETSRRDERELERLTLFSDAVVAIAITLLALELRIPELPDGATQADIRQAVGDLAPGIVTFAWSFLVVAGFWMQHRVIFQRLDRADARLTWLNMAFLFLVALLPFPSDTLGRFDLSFLTVSLYAVNVAGIALVLGLMARYSERHLIEPGSVGATMTSHAAGLFLCAAVFLASLVVAWFAPEWGPRVWWLLLVFIPVLGQRDDRGRRRLLPWAGRPGRTSGP